MAAEAVRVRRAATRAAARARRSRGRRDGAELGLGEEAGRAAAASGLAMGEPDV
jgi:hypothetical protein